MGLLLWRVGAILAVLWPSRVSGLLDGAPLDTAPEAILLGVIVPALCWFHPAFLRRPLARAAIVAIVIIKAGAIVTVQQEGWCVTFVPPTPMVRESTGKPHAWDVRADWLADDPKCSAIMTRSYHDSFELPAWFFNLPPPNDAVVRDGFHPGQIPIVVGGTGYLTVRQRGEFELLTTAPMTTSVQVDGHPVEAAEPGAHRITLERGTHAIRFEGTMLGKQWRIVPRWNGTEMGSMLFPLSTPAPPSRFDRSARPAANWLLLIVITAWAAAWLIAAVSRVHDAPLLIWSGVSAAAIVLAVNFQPPLAPWYTAAATAFALRMQTRRRYETMHGAFLLIGVPWLVYFAAAHASMVGRWTLYGIGNDNFLFQRFSYRVFMQHFWLEGGQLTFWNQPLFRWIAGVLHLTFGDSSVGQVFWDAAAVLFLAFFAYRVVRPLCGFMWGLLAAAIPLCMFLLSPTLELVGFGLSEISSAGFIYLAAFFAMRNRGVGDAVAAGLLVSLGFYTRLNNLPMALAIAGFALPLTVPSVAVWRPWTLLPLIRWRVVAGVCGGLTIAALLFMWRTWYYTGVFGLFHGTQREFLAVWKTGMTWQQAVPAMGSSLMMVLTGQDPPRFAWHTLPILVAVVVSIAGLIGAPLLRKAPLVVVAFFLSGCFGAMVTRGWGHEGRFTVHLYGVASALSVWGLAAIYQGVRKEAT